jgi:hypothetical protein
VSASRNVAIAHANSPYIEFLNSDDIWAPHFTETIMPLLKVRAADIVKFNPGIINAQGRVIGGMDLIDRVSVGLRPGGLAALMEFVRVCQIFPVPRVYRRELWDGVNFPAGRVHEDRTAILLVTRAQATPPRRSVLLLSPPGRQHRAKRDPAYASEPRDLRGRVIGEV